MILTRHFVFLHFPKTGGNFVRAVLEEHAPASWQVDRREDHGTWADIPESHRDLPRLAFVRNPFAWYVSWYFFQLRTRDPFFVELSEDGKLDFAAAMRKALLSGGPMQEGEGPMLQLLWEILGPGLEGCRVGKVETMRDDLPRLFSSCCEVPPAMADAISSLPPQNTSSHGHYSRYYDDELRALVRDKDGPIFDHFGYEWENAPA